MVLNLCCKEPLETEFSWKLELITDYRLPILLFSLGHFSNPFVLRSWSAAGILQIDCFFGQVRHLELKKEKEVDRENLVKFLSEAMATQFRNPSIWS